jgi:hypothetical protein
VQILIDNKSSLKQSYGQFHAFLSCAFVSRIRIFSDESVLHPYHPVSIAPAGIIVLVIALVKRNASSCIIQGFPTHGETALPNHPALREAYISILSYLTLDSNGIDQSHLFSQ